MMQFASKISKYKLKAGIILPSALIILFLTAMKFQYADPPSVSWDEIKKLEGGEAHQGRWEMNDSDFRYVDDPSVAVHDDGHTAVVWADQEEQNIFLQVFEPDGEERFSDAINVSQQGEKFSWLPRLKFNPENPDEIYVLWQEIIFSGGSHGGEILFSKSDDGGRNFNEPQNLSNTPKGAGKGRLSQRLWDNGSLDLTVGPDGQIYTVWSEYEGDLRFSKSTDGGESFSEPETLASDDEAGPARGPSITTDADGEIYIAWSLGEEDTADIHFSHSTDEGSSFESPQPLYESDGHSDAPQVEGDTRGNLFLVYGEGNGSRQPQYDVMFSRMNNDEQSFSEPKSISRGHSEEFSSVHYPSVVLDGSDNIYVIWDLFPESGRESLGLGFTASGNGGQTFSEPTTVPGMGQSQYGMNGSRQGSLMRKMDVNSEGQIAVVNSTFQAGDASYIWMINGLAE